MIPLFLSYRFNSTVTIWKTFAVLPNAASAAAGTASPSAHNTGKPLFFADAFPRLSKGRATTNSLLAIVIVAKFEPTKRFPRLNWVKLKYSLPPPQPPKIFRQISLENGEMNQTYACTPPKTPAAVKVFLLSRNKNDATQKDDGAGN